MLTSIGTNLIGGANDLPFNDMIGNSGSLRFVGEN